MLGSCVRISRLAVRGQCRCFKKITLVSGDRCRDSNQIKIENLVGCLAPDIVEAPKNLGVQLHRLLDKEEEFCSKKSRCL